jgi:hypothetical protein
VWYAYRTDENNNYAKCIFSVISGDKDIASDCKGAIESLHRTAGDMPVSILKPFTAQIRNERRRAHTLSSNRAAAGAVAWMALPK